MMIRKVAASLAVASLTSALAFAQSKPSDRRAFIWPDMPTTDDPRRVPAPPGRSGPPGGLVLKGGMVFDSVKTAAYPATVVIDGNHIVAVLPPTSTNWPADAKMIDVTGETVLPGLIDLHVHLTYPDRTTMVDEQASEGNAVLRGLDHLDNLIEHGFTSVRDMNGVLHAPYVLSEWMAADRVPGPRVFTVGHIITGTGGHAADRPITPIHGPEYAMEADGPIEWRAAVRQNFKDGASVIKIASLFDQEEVKAAVEEAHALGLKVACDCETFYTQWAVEAGVDMIEHPLPRTDQTIREMAEHHTEADPTLAVYQTMLDTVGGYYGTASRRFTIGPQEDFDLFKKMKAAGIKMGIGTDTIGDGFHYVPNTYIEELKWFVKGGYTPAEALITATKTNAEMLDMGDKLGTIEPGKLADILVVRGTPQVDANDLKKVDKVIKDGYLMVDQGQVQMMRHADTPLPKPAPPDYVH